MIARLEGWRERATALSEEIRLQAPGQYLRLRDDMTGRDWQKRLELLAQKDPVAYGWVCVLNAAFDLDFELERLREEIIYRAGRNGVHLESRPLAASTTSADTGSPQAMLMPES